MTWLTKSSIAMMPLRICLTSGETQLLKESIPVTYKNDKEKLSAIRKSRFFDFDNVEENNFLTIKQLWVEE
jgi:type I site-specific restriction-modification system R (restriction) subunit